MFFLNLYVLEKFVYFFKCDNVKVKSVPEVDKSTRKGVIAFKGQRFEVRLRYQFVDFNKIS